MTDWNNFERACFISSTSFFLPFNLNIPHDLHPSSCPRWNYVYMSLYARFVTQNLPVCHSSRIHLATVPLVSVPCLRIYDTRVVCVLFSMAGEGTCDAATILFSPLAVLRWLPRKVQPTRPLVTANRFHPWLCASSFTTLTYLTLLLPCLIIINYHPVLLYKI